MSARHVIKSEHRGQEVTKYVHTDCLVRTGQEEATRHLDALYI